MEKITSLFFKYFFILFPINETIFYRKLEALYQKSGFSADFVKIRFWDAPLEKVEKLLPKRGHIVELGCGEGMGSNYFAICSSSREILGVDLDRRRIEQAYKGLKNTKFLYGDITKINIPSADSILLVHVLHHLTSYEKQEQLLKMIKSKLKKRGQLLIVEVEPKFSWKYFLAWFTDHFIVAWLFEKRLYSPIYFRKAVEWRKILVGLGYSCKIINADKSKPFSHVVIDCRINKS